MVRSDGYVKYKLHGRKFYRAVTIYIGRIRYSAKIFRRATDAKAYSEALVERFNRLKAVESPRAPELEEVV
jgi:hypothetical protein